MEDLAVMAAGVNDKTVSPAMVKLCQSASKAVRAYMLFVLVTCLPRG